MPKKSVEIDDDTGELELMDSDDSEDEFDWGDDSEEESEEEESDEEEEEDESSDEEDEEEEESEEEDEDEVEAKPSKVDVRVLSRRMDSFEKNLPKLIGAAVKAAIGGKDKDSDEEEEEEEEIPEEMDSKTLVKLLTKRIAKTVNEAVDGKLKPYQEAMDDAKATAVWREAAQKYGDPFIKSMPILARFMIRTGITDPHKGWKGFRMLRPEQRQKLKVDAQKTQKSLAKRKVDADSEDTVTKRPERTPFKKLKGSDSDVFDGAFTSSVKTHLKKRRQ